MGSRYNCPPLRLIEGNSQPDRGSLYETNPNNALLKGNPSKLPYPQGGPLPVISGVISPINGLING